MDTKQKGKNAKKKKFNQTRQLINLALNDEWTQTDIAKACRVQQSVVSAWKNGAAKATENQLIQLLKIYGHKLRRNSFRVYQSIDSETGELTFHKVEGQVILSQSLTDARRQNSRLVKKIPEFKLVVHDQGKGKFRVIQQNRLKFSQSNSELECSQEDAIWNSIIGDQINVSELLEFIGAYCIKHLNDYLSDAYSLPFLIRKALLNHGHHVDGIEEYPAVW
jgi:transcriptional regulator with XRE-family HTH domain